MIYWKLITGFLGKTIGGFGIMQYVMIASVAVLGGMTIYIKYQSNKIDHLIGKNATLQVANSVLVKSNKSKDLLIKFEQDLSKAEKLVNKETNERNKIANTKLAQDVERLRIADLEDDACGITVIEKTPIEKTDRLKKRVIKRSSPVLRKAIEILKENAK